MKSLNIAVIGATGLVGTKIIEILESTDVKTNNMLFFATKEEEGKEIIFRDNTYYVQELSKKFIEQIDIDVAFLAAGSDVSKNYVDILLRKNVYVIDNSSYFRMNNDALLVVPEVNGHLLEKEKYMIANANCSTIQAILPIAALNQKNIITKIIYTTYQAVSGSGTRGLKSLLSEENNYNYEIKNNLIPQIDIFTDMDYTKEEIKMINETKKILNNYLLDISSTCVRVPITNCHSVDVIVEFEHPVNIERLAKAIDEYPGITVIDDVKNEKYPMPILVDGKDDVYVGRIRRDLAFENGIRFFVVGDNLRKGAALNAVQILTKMVERGIFDV